VLDETIIRIKLDPKRLHGLTTQAETEVIVLQHHTQVAVLAQNAHRA